jgi:chromosome segregation ATPase
MKLPIVSQKRLRIEYLTSAHLRGELRSSRDQVIRLEERLRAVESELKRERERSARLEAKLERVEDDALFAAGMRPIHHPEALQYQPRQVGEAELQASGVASPVEWREVRARLEKEAAEQAEREIGLEVEAWARKVSGGQA